MEFKKIVLMTSVILLILTLVVVGVALYNQKYNSVFPPVVSDCPDYWENTSSTNPSYCEDVKNLAKDKCAKSIDFSQYPFTGNDGLCNKSKWAKGCGITWDGVTNNSDACSTSDDQS